MRNEVHKDLCGQLGHELASKSDDPFIGFLHRSLCNGLCQSASKQLIAISWLNKLVSGLSKLNLPCVP